MENNAMSVCCSCLSMVFPYIGNFKYPHRRTDQEQHFFKNPSERSRKGKIALHFTERPLATVVTLCFRWPLREVFIPYVWFLVSASLKVRPCAEQDKYVSQDSCCFFRALVYLALSARFLRFSREFRMWPIQYFTSLSSERQHFLFTISSSGSA